MEISPVGYLKKIKRYWGRRRRYQNLHNASKIKRKIKIIRLGNKKKEERNDIQDKKKVVVAHKTGSMVNLSPWKLMEKFHATYVDAMWRLAGEDDKWGNGSFKVVKKVPKCGAVVDPVLMSGYRNDMVDSRMVMEIYKRLLSFRRQHGDVAVAGKF